MSNESGAEWLVLLEAADSREGSAIDRSSFLQFVSSWATAAPTTLYTPNRYALQVVVRATDPPSALSVAISLWQDSLRRSELPEWQLVRAEIMTPEELEEELQAAERGRERLTSTPSFVTPGDVVAEDLLRHALHDSLTGLPGRELFLDEVGRALAGASPSAVLALVIAQFDWLQTLDPSLGCSVRDDALVEIAGRLIHVVRRRDTIARVGPAEFALLIEVGDGRDADCLARRLVDLFRYAPIDESAPPAVRASVGVAMSSSTYDADQLILMAEVAVEVAREAGGDCYRTFAADPDSV
ncbi:MAG: GGDEF domain-containing protein [Nitriliruptorales bacterium]